MYYIAIHLFFAEESQIFRRITVIHGFAKQSSDIRKYAGVYTGILRREPGWSLFALQSSEETSRVSKRNAALRICVSDGGDT